MLLNRKSISPLIRVRHTPQSSPAVPELSLLQVVRVVAILILTSIRGDASILLNEVLYDPAGGDTGYEFVELISTTEFDVSLEGVRLEFCNGAAPGDWQTLWEGGIADSIAAGALFLLGEEKVPLRDRTVVLAMQNGPDAIRLIRAGAELDLLGYGEDLPSELYEAWPAEDPSGWSLSRRPDGVDTDQNALDWFDCEATPGLLNYPDFRVKLIAAAPTLPAVPAGEDLLLRIRAENTGAESWPLPLELWAGDLASTHLPVALPGHVSEVDLVLSAPPEGPLDLLLEVRSASGRMADTLSLALRVGLGPLLLTEVQFAPETGGEWVECQVRLPLNGLEHFTLSDLSGTIDDFMPPALEAGDRFLLCADREMLLLAWPHLPDELVVELSPWPSLANSGASTIMPAWTDGLRLRDDRGRLSDTILYRGDWVPDKGVSLERIYHYSTSGCSPWSPCPVGATPLLDIDPALVNPGSSPRPGVDLVLNPNPFNPESERTAFFIQAVGEGVTLRLFDAAGRAVQTISGSLGAGQARLVWDGRDRFGRQLPDGAYPYLLEWESVDGLERMSGVCGLLRGGRS
ncbi:MAG: hypothetical protein GY835_09825 [bacterium]|nr:hypothetical protein [bacterium]